MADFYDMIQKNIQIMNDLSGFDVVIVCCSSVKQAQFWQTRLTQGKGSVMPSDAAVLAVDEDWPGGAGNALGTLYAFKKAQALALETLGLDILAGLIAGKLSVGLYHTAGKGTRLAPLPGSENNNKPGVKLPCTIIVDGKPQPITILEAVVKQTGCYAKSRPGRLSVFWGDQVFIPTAPAEYTVDHHIDILCSLGPMLSETEWQAKGMDKYGLIARSKSGDAAQVEKVSHATAVQLLAGLGEIESVGASLGSFSLSSLMLVSLLEEFAKELDAKKGKFDSDPHLWMPMTLEKSSYLHLMGQKGIDSTVSSTHYDRIRAMLETFNSKPEASALGLFGPVDVGQGVLWWDYGQLKLYQKNTMFLTESSRDAAMMRKFLGMEEQTGCVRDSEVINTSIDDISCVSSSWLGSNSEGETTGFVRNSVLSNVRCKHIEADGCVLINVTAECVIARPGSIIYNILDDKNSAGLIENGTLKVGEKDVIVGVFDEAGMQSVMRSNLDTDGGKAWDVKLPDNTQSFAEVYQGNTDACPSTLQKVISSSHDAAWSAL